MDSPRSCDGCTLCCKLLGIAALEKPPAKWCAHCAVGEGCGIYDTRPDECRTFNCAYLTTPGIGAEWAPMQARFVVAALGNRIIVHADPNRPDAWRKAPYYAQIRDWAAALTPRRGQVIVMTGAQAIGILPQGETNLGAVTSTQTIVTGERMGPTGKSYEMLVLDKDDPRLRPQT